MQRGRRMATDQLHRALSLRLSLMRKLSDSDVSARAVPFIMQESPSPAESTPPSIAPAPAPTAYAFDPPDPSQSQPPGSRSTQFETQTQTRDEARRLRPPTRQSFERVSSSDLDADADNDSAGIGLLEQNIACGLR